MARVLVIDNYDSFTYNLVQLLEVLGARCEVVLNDALDVSGALARTPDGILLSPGPCTPDEAGVSLHLLRALMVPRAEPTPAIPLLGVCLGHQAMAQALGGRVVRARQPRHGKTSPIEHDGLGVFQGLPSPFEAARYNSLLVDPRTLPADLVISARSDEGEIMGLRHRTLPIEGVQFHPESILTPRGEDLLRNWVTLVNAYPRGSS
ncbi:anthranilate synthase component II [Chondromyces crocatus]|uniref:Anthranilate synthase subunit II n=1 Tax=Chondromyces crocatus TaxID=52 RepID=A0A0K1EJP6_CHOCO|nr:aminodeoxychorismate/anthranilate synthase component II [Chondromyces crocatus]AKT41069.1 anthranilate synthase subunit II [Chondromyces crocatus]